MRGGLPLNRLWGCAVFFVNCKTLTRLQTKIFDFPYPPSEATLKLICVSEFKNIPLDVLKYHFILVLIQVLSKYQFHTKTLKSMTNFRPKC